jgi:hypothetical protein
VAELAYAAVSEAAFCGFKSHRAYQDPWARSLTIFRLPESGPDGKALVCYTRALARGQRVRFPYSPPNAEGTAEWSANGPESRGMLMHSIWAFDSSTFRQVCTGVPNTRAGFGCWRVLGWRQVREPGRNGPVVTRFPLCRTRRFKSSSVHQGEPTRAPTQREKLARAQQLVLAAEPSCR